ncbi:phosphatase PAP2 family protein [Methylobacterium sp. A54F]
MRNGTRSTDGFWPLIAAVALMGAAGLALVGLSFDALSAVPVVLTCGLLAAGAAFYRRVRPDERIAASLAHAAQLLAFTAAAVPLSYAVARAGGPAWDARFLAWDRALGFDWQACLAAINAHPGLSAVASLAYGSVMVQILVALLGLCFTDRRAACRAFVLSIILAALASILISGLMPGMTVFMHLDLPQAAFPNVPFIDDSHFLSVRDGSLRRLSLDGAQGIIAFPSFHAALAVTLAAALWQLPGLRWPGLVLNALVIAATPTHGGHYLVDVLAGTAVGLAAVGLARLEGRVQPRPAPLLSPAAAAPR